MKLRSSMIALAAVSAVAFTAYADTTTTTTTTETATAQATTNMAPPKALENKVFNGMVGTWKGESDMMGTKMHDVLRVKWALNHQFLIMQLTATGVQQPKNQYEGMGVFGVDAQDNAQTWWFDSWGANSVSTGTGTFGDNILTLNDSNAMFKETRSFEIKGNNEMVMHAQGTMTWEGKPSSFDTTTVYKKQ
jgi:hypothetical protein